MAALPSLLANPSSVANLLAQYLPEASTFFLTWVICASLLGQMLITVIQVHYPSGFVWRSWRIFEFLWAYPILRQAVAPGQHTTLCV
jgi:hypothetical protein